MRRNLALRRRLFPSQQLSWSQGTRGTYICQSQNVVWIPELGYRPGRDHDQVGHESNDPPSHHYSNSALQLPLPSLLRLALAIDEICMLRSVGRLYPGSNRIRLRARLEHRVGEWESNDANHREDEEGKELSLRMNQHGVPKLTELKELAIPGHRTSNPYRSSCRRASAPTTTQDATPIVPSQSQKLLRDHTRPCYT